MSTPSDVKSYPLSRYLSTYVPHGSRGSSPSCTAPFVTSGPYHVDLAIHCITRCAAQIKRRPRRHGRLRVEVGLRLAGPFGKFRCVEADSVVVRRRRSIVGDKSTSGCVSFVRRSATGVIHMHLVEEYFRFGKKLRSDQLITAEFGHTGRYLDLQKRLTV